MNKILLAFALMLTCLLSCDKEAPKPLTSEQIRQRIDSEVVVRIQQVDAQAKIELDYRIKIEVKIKADSILQTILQQQATTDSPKNGTTTTK